MSITDGQRKTAANPETDAAVGRSRAFAERPQPDFDETPFIDMWTDIAREMGSSRGLSEKAAVEYENQNGEDFAPLRQFGLSYIGDDSYKDLNRVEVSWSESTENPENVAQPRHSLLDYIRGAALSMNPFATHDAPYTSPSDYVALTGDCQAIAVDIYSAWYNLIESEPAIPEAVRARIEGPTNAGNKRRR